MDQLLLDGQPRPLGPALQLRVGALSLLFQGGGLRYVRYGGLEVLRGVYAALRDRNWGTVAPALSDLCLEPGEEGLRLEFDAVYRAEGIDFRASYRLEVHPQGFSFALSGRAHTGFYRNRLGFCVLHPMEAAGAPCRVEHADGSQEEARLPRQIAALQPIPPFTELRVLEHQAAPGLWGRLEFSGDLFEMEDQRNWTDASFKTFCTPLRRPFPVWLEAGTTVEQRVSLRMRGAQRSRKGGRSTPARSLRLGSRRWGLPALGTEMASHGQALSHRQLERLRTLGLAHLRVSLNLAELNGGGGLEKLAQAIAQARGLGVGLEVALTPAEPPELGLEALRAALEEHRAELVRFLVYPQRAREANHAPYLEAARRVLGGFGKPVFGGTDSDFFFLNAYPVPPEAVDGLTFALNPQVHAFDNASLVETLRCQPLVAQEARRLSGGKPVVVSPLTFKPRWNPYATAAPPPTPPGELPPEVDPRQLSLFGAGWTLGSVGALAQGKVEAITLFETTGWRGLMETEAGSPLPQRFPSVAGGVFPLYHVLADLAEFRGGEVVEVIPSAPLEFGGLALRQGRHSCLLLANYTGCRQSLELEGFPALLWLRKLHEHNLLEAVAEPERWRQNRTQPRAGPIELPPYAYVRVELDVPPPCDDHRPRPPSS